MKKLLFITALVLFSTQSYASEITGNYVVGCVSKDALEDLVSYNGDPDGFSQALTNYLSMGMCDMFSRGEQVRIIDLGFTMTKVRPQGRTQSYYVQSNQVR